MLIPIIIHTRTLVLALCLRHMLNTVNSLVFILIHEFFHEINSNSHLRLHRLKAHIGEVLPVSLLHLRYLSYTLNFIKSFIKLIPQTVTTSTSHPRQDYINLVLNTLHLSMTCLYPLNLKLLIS